MAKSVIAIALSLPLSTPSMAADPALGCFTRTYDRAHLARHPAQLVTAVKLHIYRPPPEGGGEYWFNAQFRLRGHDKALRTSGLCHEKVSAIFPPGRRTPPPSTGRCPSLLC
jgi:hypothetical protein